MSRWLRPKVFAHVVLVLACAVLLSVAIFSAHLPVRAVLIVCAVAGLCSAAYLLPRAPRAETPVVDEVGPRGQQVTNSLADGSVVTGSVFQVGSTVRSAVLGDRNVVGDHNLVAEPGGVVVQPAPTW